MSLVELHPEELIDREASGTLSPSEREFLESHLARCSSCRLERRARDDFAEELAADDGHLDVALLVSHALRAANTVEPPVEPPAEAPIAATPLARRTRRPGRAAMVLLVAAATMCAGVAAAAWSGLVPPLALIAGPTAPAASQASPVATTPHASRPGRASAPSGVVPQDEPSADAPAVSAEAPSEAAGDRLADGQIGLPPAISSSPAALPSAVQASAAGAARVEPVRSPAADTSRAARVARAKTATGNGSSEVSHPGTDRAPAAPAPEPPPRAAAAIFSEANEALRASDKVRAQGLYRELLRLYPTSPEARVSRATLGRLLLEQGEGAAALRTFDESLASGAGAMAEEMMVGRALSFQRIGDARGEASAWLALLSTHPGSVHADRARARLAVLSPR
jgi:TolA-binding protein